MQICPQVVKIAFSVPASALFRSASAKISAQLQGDLAQPLGGPLHHVYARLSLAGEGDHVDPVLADERVADRATQVERIKWRRAHPPMPREHGMGQAGLLSQVLKNVVTDPVMPDAAHGWCDDGRQTMDDGPLSVVHRQFSTKAI